MIIIADAGPLLHLFWIDALFWALPAEEIVVVETVWHEVDQYAPQALQDSRLRRTPAIAPVPPLLLSRELDPGKKRHWLMHWHRQTDQTFWCFVMISRPGKPVRNSRCRSLAVWA